MTILHTRRAQRFLIALMLAALALAAIATLRGCSQTSRIRELSRKAKRFDQHCASVRRSLIDAAESFRSEAAQVRDDATKRFYSSAVGSYRSQDIFMCLDREIDEVTWNSRYNACRGPTPSLEEVVSKIPRHVDHSCMAKLADDLRAALPEPS